MNAEEKEESKSPEQAEKEAVAAIEELGGRVRELEFCGTVVDFSYSKVTDAGLVHLKGMTDLRSSDLRHTEVTAEGVKALQAALPECRIQWK